MRAVKQITKFLELKRMDVSKVSLPSIDITSVQPVLSSTLCENMNIPSHSQPSQQPSLSSTTFASSIPSSTPPKLQQVEVQPLDALPHPDNRFDELSQKEFLAIIRNSFKPP